MLIALGVSSCSTAKKRDGATEKSGLLSVMTSEERKEEEATYDELRAIANDPSSMLLPPSDEEEGTVEDADASLTSEPIDPVIAWAEGGFEPRRISIGDIFSDNAGPVLKKAASIADLLAGSDRDRALSSISTTESSRVPVTLSAREVATLATMMPPEAPFPTRSVALDFRTTTSSIDDRKLEALYARVEKKTLPEETMNKTASNSLAMDLETVKARIGAGERLYVIVGVTSTDGITATYPGAPLGKSDTDKVLNAVAANYPHLDLLEAEKVDDAILVSRPPEIYWEFEVRELKLKGDRLAVGENSLAQR